MDAATLAQLVEYAGEGVDWSKLRELTPFERRWEQPQRIAPRDVETIGRVLREVPAAADFTIRAPSAEGERPPGLPPPGRRARAVLIKSAPA
jgi:hypothetical protein